MNYVIYYRKSSEAEEFQDFVDEIGLDVDDAYELWQVM